MNIKYSAINSSSLHIYCQCQAVLKHGIDSIESNTLLFIFRNTHLSSVVDVRLRFPDDRSPQTLKTRSAYASEAGACTRSKASGDSDG